MLSSSSPSVVSLERLNDENTISCTFFSAPRKTKKRLKRAKPVDESWSLCLDMERCLATNPGLWVKAFHDLRTHLNRIRDLGGSLVRIETTNSSIFDLLLISTSLQFDHKHTYIHQTGTARDTRIAKGYLKYHRDYVLHVFNWKPSIKTHER